MANQPKRRFVELKVNEVSLVDTPANEQRFIVVKRLQPQIQEEHNMSINAQGATNEAPKTVEVKVEVAKAVEAAETSVDVDVEKGGTAAAFKAQCMKAGMSEEMAAKAVSAAMKAGMFGALPAGAPVAKALTAEETQQAAVDGVFAQISKAKAFTPGRQEALKAAFSTLKGLLEDLESLPDGGVKGLPTDDNMHTPNLPKGKAPPSALQDARDSPASTVVKAMEDFTAKMGEVIGVVKSLDGRIAAIEQTRSPSKGAAPELTETKTTKNTSLWNGVL